MIDEDLSSVDSLTSRSEKNDETPPSPSASRRTGTRSIALYSMALSVLAVLQVGLHHPKIINEIPQELADGRPVNDAVAKKTNQLDNNETEEEECVIGQYSA